MSPIDKLIIKNKWAIINNKFKKMIISDKKEFSNKINNEKKNSKSQVQVNPSDSDHNLELINKERTPALNQNKDYIKKSNAILKLKRSKRAYYGSKSRLKGKKLSGLKRKLQSKTILETIFDQKTAKTINKETKSINKLVQNIKARRVQNTKILRKNNQIYEIITNERCPSPTLSHNDNTDNQNQDSSNHQQDSISINETTDQANKEPREHDPKLKVKPVIRLVDIFHKYTKKARYMVNNMPRPDKLLKEIRDDPGRYVKKTRSEDENEIYKACTKFKNRVDYHKH